NREKPAADCARPYADGSTDAARNTIRPSFGIIATASGYPASRTNAGCRHGKNRHDQGSAVPEAFDHRLPGGSQSGAIKAAALRKRIWRGWARVGGAAAECSK